MDVITAAKEIIAMTEKNDMYKCQKCRNVIRVMRPGMGNLECCNKQMIELSPVTATKG